MKNTPIVSVIIASHRPAMVGVLLDSLRRQRGSSPVFEVIIVTDYPNGSLQHEFPGCHWLYLSTESISTKRNAGAQIAQGACLAFIDDDCIAASDWIAQGSAYLDNHPGTAAVEGGTTIATDPASAAAAAREYRRLEKPGFRTNNLFFRTARFRAIGGFDERFTVQREDIDLAFTALDQGYRIDYCRDIRVTHRYRRGERWDLLKNCWNRRFDPLLYRKHPGRALHMLGSPLPPSQVVILMLHLLVLLSFRKKRVATAAVIFDALLTCLLGVRRSGLHPFSLEKWADETLQLCVAPLVVLGALLYGWIVISPRRRG